MRHSLILIVLALAGAAPAPPPAAGRIVLAADAETRWVPFELTPGNQIRFAMTIDGRAVSAVLDTGVSYSVMARRFVEANRIATRPGGKATAIGGAVDIAWVDTRTIAFGGLTRTGGGLTVAALPALATGSAAPVDLLVGRDLVGTFALDIDYAAKRFRVIPSGRLPFLGTAMPLAISRDRMVYVSEVTLGATRLRPMVIDTGDGSAVTVTTAGWRAAALPDVTTTTAISYGLAGPIVSTIGIVPDLRIGALDVRNVEVRIEDTGGFSDAIGVAGRIGTGLLQNYRVLLDPAAGRMVLRRGAGADVPPRRSTSGLLVGVDRDRLRILHVMRGGPAASQVWKAGDTICSIDGVAIPSDYTTNPIAAWSAGEPGRTVMLGLCDGTRRTLTLRRFY